MQQLKFRIHIWSWEALGVIRFMWGHDPHDGISDLLRRDQKASSLSFTMWGHRMKEAICKPRWGPLPKTQPRWNLDPRLPSLQSCEKLIAIVWHFPPINQIDNHLILVEQINGCILGYIPWYWTVFNTNHISFYIAKNTYYEQWTSKHWD